LAALDDEALVEVLLAAQAAGVLGRFVSSSRQLCSLARSRVPVELCVSSSDEAALLLRSSAHGVPPFSACTRLDVRASLAADDSMVTPVLLAAADLTALRHINLEVSMPPRCKLTTQGIDARMGTVIGAVPATLPNLGSMYLHVPAFGAHCARNLAGLVQLTAICVQPSTGDPVESTAATADLTPLSRLTNLRELQLCGPPPVQPAAGVNGPFSLPSSLTRLVWEKGVNRRAVIGCWVTHLAACPGLQELVVTYKRREHSSAHPAVLVPILAQHNRHLRMLDFCNGHSHFNAWDLPVAGLQDPIAPTVWCPDAALAALTGLENLAPAADPRLTVNTAAGWQHLAQMSALTGLGDVDFSITPSQLAGTALPVVSLGCAVALGSLTVGELLLACPWLQRACVWIVGDGPPALPSPPDVALPQLPNLQSLALFCCNRWGHTAAAHFAQVAPLLSGVTSLQLSNWPHSSSSSSSSSNSSSRRGCGGGGESGAGGIQLPDLSPCTVLSKLVFSLEAVPGATLEQEDVMSMLAPLMQLQHLELERAHGLKASVVVTLQHMLPQLQFMQLSDCGRLLPDPSCAHQQQQLGQASAQETQAQDWHAEQLMTEVLLPQGWDQMVD
jgi:hypothetical protein